MTARTRAEAAAQSAHVARTTAGFGQRQISEVEQVKGMPQINPLQRADIPELSQFLISSRGVPSTYPLFSHEALSWKYFDGPTTASENPVRSLIARSAGKIIGHVGICLRQFIIPGDRVTPVTAMHAIDWAGSPSHPGTGALLMLQAFATSETQYAVDGTEQARALFPKLCFEDKPKLTILRKMLTPFHRLRTADQRLLRKWAGTAKDTATVWRTRTPEVPHTVELRSVAAFDPEVDCLQRRPSARVVTCLRDHSLLNYFLRCPLPGFSGWTIHTSKRVIGFALLKVTPQGRIQRGKIVDCWLDTDDLGCWQAAMVALIDHLRALSADDVLCYATTPSLHAALLWSGFTKLREQNVYIRDKEQSLPLDVPFGFSMLDGDRAFL